MTTETISLLRKGLRVFVSGCGASTFVSAKAGKRYFDMLEKLDPAYLSLSNGEVFEVERCAACEFIDRVMASAPIKYVVPMMNDRRRHRMPD